MDEPAAPAPASPFRALVREFAPAYGPYEAIYRQVHENAELSWQEFGTAAVAAAALGELAAADNNNNNNIDLEIKTGIGGTAGLVGILRNGAGPTVLLRADMDALPVREETGLAYACTREATDAGGVVRPVMHACGHDMHVAALLAAAALLVASRARWAGTVVFLFQPAEETQAGARRLVEAGLFAADRVGCPVPDVVLGQHVFSMPAGTVATKAGPLMAGMDSLVVRVFGQGAHGSMPQHGTDAVLLASHIVVKLQTIVSRGVAPGELAVVTVGALHAGSVDNLLAAEAELKINLRSARAGVRQLLLDRVEAIVRAECAAAGCTRPPVFEYGATSPPMVNDEAATARLSRAFAAHFGARFGPISMASASEDFSVLAAAAGDKPYCFWALGGHDPADWARRAAEGRLGSVPMNHAADFAPAIQPTLQAGAEALAVAAWAFLAGEEEMTALRPM